MRAFLCLKMNLQSLVLGVDERGIKRQFRSLLGCALERLRDGCRAVVGCAIPVEYIARALQIN